MNEREGGGVVEVDAATSKGQACEQILYIFLWLLYKTWLHGLGAWPR